MTNDSLSPSSSSNMNVPPKELPIRMISTVIKGFGRGSKELGIPTANLCPQNLISTTSFQNLPTGIYFGFANIQNKVYKAAISIGYNPTYDNEHKTIEPHLIAQQDSPTRFSSKCGETLLEDLYDEKIKLSIVGYLRPELPFEGIDKLIEAIKHDIVQAEQKCDVVDEELGMLVNKEKAWVESDGIDL
ncbi:riboflavin kinase [Chaetoceros tenuissimus]|uniref:riboflavin kinase n=1 Tax=Chaetoceros tenuissimus TaxID=426638 RepID=A0AAD3CQI1_9STRA|nr:riboflavin kinase [Chaetoceros tenuissimus]